MTNWEDSWSTLCHLCTQYDLWWVCISNFNEILKVDEKSRGPIRPERQMQEFHNCLDFCGLRIWDIQACLSHGVIEDLMVC